MDTSDPTFESPWLIGGIGVFIVLAALFAVSAIRESFRLRRAKRLALEERERARNLEEQRKREQAVREQESRAEEVRVLQSDFASSPHLVAEHYRAAIAQLETATTKSELAAEHQRRSAYTPFWEAVEASLGALNEYRLSVERTTNAIRRHESLRERIRTAPELADVTADPIPRAITEIGRSNAGGVVADRLKEAVYVAHTDFKFASIYEQRRTTAAVISGFSSVQDAVDRLGGVIRSENAMIIDAVQRQAGAVERQQHRNAEILGEVAQELRSSSYGSSLGLEITQMNDSLKAIERRLV